ncbi:MAG: hypothetical protein RIC30_20500 [Marinoscillum sp.]|uniref:hypothetical protein n=1 Tax=Marinoscillum sp. TaxID=2024838 RepID=UPI00330510F6
MRTLIIIFLTIFNLLETHAQTIDITGIGEYKIGTDTSELFSKLTEYDHTVFDGIHYFSKNKLIHLMAWTYGNSTIRGLGTANPNFKLANGICVGTPIQEVLRFYPNAEYGYSIETGENYLVILDEYITVDGRERTMILYITSLDDSKDLELNTECGKPTQISSNSKVSRVEVYNWN